MDRIGKHELWNNVSRPQMNTNVIRLRWSAYQKLLLHVYSFEGIE